MVLDVSRAGLCATCSHVRVVRSARGSAFLRCAQHDEDGRFPKYPRLPVQTCAGFTPGGPTEGDADGRVMDQ